MKTLACLSAVTLLVVTSHAGANVITGPVVNPANGHSYYLLEQDTWTNSEAFAQTLGGHLVTINDAAENEWVFDTFADIGGVDRNLWIGLNDAANEGTFVWSSGDLAAYRNWDIGQPDDIAAGEDYGHIWAPNIAGTFTAEKWNDLDDRIDFAFAQPSPVPMHGVVEVIPEPASLALLGLGGLTLLRRPRRER